MIAIWSQSYFFIIILFMLTVAIGFNFLDWKTKEEMYLYEGVDRILEIEFSDLFNLICRLAHLWLVYSGS